jgi:hypothetical protein
MLKLESAMSHDKFPDRLSRPMGRAQAATLRFLMLCQVTHSERLALFPWNEQGAQILILR